MTDWLVVAILAFPFLAAALNDVRIAWTWYRASRRKPPIETLTLNSRLLAGVALGAALTAVIGFLSAVFTATGVRLLPPPFPLILLYVGILAPSIAVIPYTRALKKWERELRHEA